jgi:hypothetical protein
VLIALAVGAGAATGAVRHSLDPNDEKKIVICHWDEAGKWTRNEVSVNAIIQGQGGHANHPNDIIPPFDYSGGQSKGLNWDDTGIPIYENGCALPQPVPEPIGVFVACKATSADGTTYSATFGYNSENAADVTIPIGGDNNVTPAEFSGGQPTVFRGFGNYADVFSDDQFMSRRHAHLSLQGGDVRLEDLGSSNGTFVRLRGDHLLVPGDVMRIGNVLLRFESQ